MIVKSVLVLVKLVNPLIFVWAVLKNKIENLILLICNVNVWKVIHKVKMLEIFV